MKLHPFSLRQKQLLTWWMDGSPVADKDFVCAEGSIRSGKTLCAIDSFINWSQTNFSNEIFIIAGVSVGALQRNVLEPLFSLLNTKDIAYTYRRTEKYVIIGSNRYYLFGGNSEASQDTLQGITSAGLFADEAPLMPRSFIEQAMARCSVEGAKYFFTLNPASPYHWFKTEILDRIDEMNGVRLHFTMDDNPSLTVDTKERYKRMFTGLFYKRYIEGLWVVAEGAIYDMFNADTHVIDVPQNRDFFDKCIAAVDYATSSVMTFGLYGIKDDTIYLIKEYYWDAKEQMKQKTDVEYVKDLKSFIDGWNVKHIYVDPSASSFQATCRYANMHIIRNAKNDVVNGIRTVASKLQQNKFFIDKECKYTLKEIQSYTWDVKAQQLGEDRPVKKNDHAMDRDRYAIHTFFSKPKQSAIQKPKGF